MTSSLKFASACVIALLAVAVVMVAIAAGQVKSSPQPVKLGRCFPAAHWGPAPEKYRPCVRVTHVEEDGSFRFKVSDADGTVRYTSGVGALDR